MNGPLASVSIEDDVLASTLDERFLKVASTRVSVDELVGGANTTNSASGAILGGSSSSSIEC